MAKFVKLSERAAIRVEAIQFPDGKQGVSLRQFYTTQKEPDQWKVGHAGIFLPLKEAAKIGKYIRQMAEDPEIEFTQLDVKQPKKEPPKKTKGRAK